ncbi:MAG: hypothetical protein PHW02_07140 [bacterium]|nr:hypothetical protein [bacterium]
MTYNIEILKEKNKASFVFSHINEHISKTGAMGYNDETIKQIVVVLKQSLDTANVESVNRIEYFSGQKKLSLFIKSGGIYGLLVDSKTNVEIESALIKEKVEEKQIEEQPSKSKIVLKERKKIAVKGGKGEEQAEEPTGKVSAAPKTETPVQTGSDIKVDSSTFETIKNAASDYLEDFSDDIINNIVHEMKLNTALMTGDDVEKFLKRLFGSSKMIIGPSQSQKMIDDIKKKIT